MANQNVEKDSEGFICSNPKCQKTFATPILVQDLSSDDTSPYSACPVCLTKIQDAEKTEAKKTKHKAKEGSIEKARAKVKQGKEPVSEEIHCSHHFGYLCQRPKTEKIPEECMECAKILECMLAQLKGSIISEVTAKTEKPEKTAKAPADDDLEGKIEEQAEPEVRQEPVNAKPSKDEFLVENLGMLYSSWSDTACIDRETLADWGKKIGFVEIEAANGKKATCKVYAIEMAKGTVQLPAKIQSALQISRGHIVTVKPVNKGKDLVKAAVSFFTREVI